MKVICLAIAIQFLTGCAIPLSANMKPVVPYGKKTEKVIPNKKLAKNTAYKGYWWAMFVGGIALTSVGMVMLENGDGEDDRIAGVVFSSVGASVSFLGILRGTKE